MTIEHVAIATSALVAIVSLYFAFYKNKRESRAQYNDDAETSLTLLRDQNKTLTDALDFEREQKREQAEKWQQRECEWKEEKREYMTRISAVERDYRNLVLTVTTMGFCANASTCENYNPGDRRKHIAQDTQEG